MGINPTDFKECIIMPCLRGLEAYSPEMNTPAATKLLLGTAVVESGLGYYLRQLEHGPARGVYQMEPATYDDIWDNFIHARPSLKKIFQDRFGENVHNNFTNLAGDLYLATTMARVHYFRNPEKLPPAHQVKDLARYWKMYYNTHLGKGTVKDFITNYQKYLIFEA